MQLQYLPPETCTECALSSLAPLDQLFCNCTRPTTTMNRLELSLTSRYLCSSQAETIEADQPGASGMLTSYFLATQMPAESMSNLQTRIRKMCMRIMHGLQSDWGSGGSKYGLRTMQLVKMAAPCRHRYDAGLMDPNLLINLVCILCRGVVHASLRPLKMVS